MYSITEKQLDEAGFKCENMHLPFVLRAYEKELPNGNILVLSRPAREAQRHIATEFSHLHQGTNKRLKPVRCHWIENDEDFAESAAGRGRTIEFGKQK
jgi:hypothetical protein